MRASYGVSFVCQNVMSHLQGYPGYFQEPHLKSMGHLDISRVNWQLCNLSLFLSLLCCMQYHLTLKWLGHFFFQNVILFSIVVHHRCNIFIWNWSKQWMFSQHCGYWWPGAFAGMVALTNFGSFLCRGMTLYAGFILCMCLANETPCYIVKSSLIGWTHTQNDPSVWWIYAKRNFNYPSVNEAPPGCLPEKVSRAILAWHTLVGTSCLRKCEERACQWNCWHLPVGQLVLKDIGCPGSTGLHKNVVIISNKFPWLIHNMMQSGVSFFNPSPPWTKLPPLHRHYFSVHFHEYKILYFH